MILTLNFDFDIEAVYCIMHNVLIKFTVNIYVKDIHVFMSLYVMNFHKMPISDTNCD